MSGDVHVRFRERLGVRFPRATRLNVYVGSERAGRRVMESITHFLTRRLKLKVNQAKSAVARPQERTSKQGDRYLRTLLMHGARAVLSHSGNLTKTTPFRTWARGLAPCSRRRTSTETRQRQVRRRNNRSPLVYA